MYPSADYIETLCKPGTRYKVENQAEECVNLKYEKSSEKFRKRRICETRSVNAQEGGLFSQFPTDS